MLALGTPPWKTALRNNYTYLFKNSFDQTVIMENFDPVVMEKTILRDGLKQNSMTGMRTEKIVHAGQKLCAKTTNPWMLTTKSFLINTNSPDDIDAAERGQGCLYEVVWIFCSAMHEAREESQELFLRVSLGKTRFQ